MVFIWIKDEHFLCRSYKNAIFTNSQKRTYLKGVLAKTERGIGLGRKIFYLYRRPDKIQKIALLNSDRKKFKLIPNKSFRYYNLQLSIIFLCIRI